MVNHIEATPGSDHRNRRDFLKKLAAAGALMWFDSNLPLARILAGAIRSQPADFEFTFRTVAIGHLDDLKSWMEKIDRTGKMSRQANFREYIGGFRFQVPETIPNARSIIIVAMPLLGAAVIFHFKGRKIEIPIPSGYTDGGITTESVKERLLKDVIGERRWKLERTRLPLKLLAVRSGLAEYGRNNISYVDGYGSYHQLRAFYTDYAFADDHWRTPVMMRECKNCSICRHRCPTQAIRKTDFVIDAGRCLTLYNELADPIPDWIDPRVHHTLVGCLKCQHECPVNEELAAKVETIAEIDERDTDFILNGGRIPERQQAIIARLKKFPAAEDLAYLARNLGLVLNNPSRKVVKE